jgi:hypothetical protein
LISGWDWLESNEIKLLMKEGTWFTVCFAGRLVHNM